MKPTALINLIALAGFSASASYIVVSRFYTYFPPIPSSVAITLGALACLLLGLGLISRRRIGQNQIGFDRSQLDPTRAASFLVLAQSCAWAGALFFGVYAGFAAYILPRWDLLVAASYDGPRVIACVVTSCGVMLAALWLERGLQAPPPAEGEPA
ncbi:DUF3180 domain-containing protein [Corynebacterium sp. ES2794-CONJ1]|uniref:DUF3180 domain-containing protein n=1 Tax=unclassified Corynebacterium TaxID=2624378 RepID=UPI002166EE2A|nr:MULTISPECIES: DUF3180 domain-containing protein [unclassified Corynebacterium]MCS4490245.1 DUF3180 domain-containing protein [Corynebacterium sp. ES2775-CONJ]MCS4491944.1 DUF3180 domain-containing protein [Corynebacterium sp. ES2715-CONJ3]MCS4532049.1 DUF3180 domain-containing protein [Corynebacterium sp. ES2730-CONJ]MCU9519450.1 DUF3180 domain-containing protein [Corynebacterium sp. ES2794-CONJ1]